MNNHNIHSLCRTCFIQFSKGARCPKCGSPKIISHPELFSLNIAHMDCDAFYASVEKRDRPELRDKPVIIGGGQRGVVSTACYIARIRGVKSAMPMFKALKLCPEAIVIKPRMELYSQISRSIRDMMNELTPDVEPLSLDEAFMDLSGTQKLHGIPPAIVLAKLLSRMKDELGITGSIGLSHNKFLAKIASDLDKPNGFHVIGHSDTQKFLENKSIRIIWGVGTSTQETLIQSGIHTTSDLLKWEKHELIAKFGSMGERLYHLSRGQDKRRVSSVSETKSISNETTFVNDEGEIDLLLGHLWRMSEQVSDRAKAKEYAGDILTLKLKTKAHKIVTRRISLREPTQYAEVIYQNLIPLLKGEIAKAPFRLLGVGLSGICPPNLADLTPDLLDPAAHKKNKAEKARDQIRARFGKKSIISGRNLR